jgi:hypothetical protein
MEISGSDVRKEDHDRVCERTNRRRRHQEMIDIPRTVLEGRGKRMRRDRKGIREIGRNRNEMNENKVNPVDEVSSITNWMNSSQ